MSPAPTTADARAWTRTELVPLLALMAFAAALLPATMAWVALRTGGILSGPDGPYAPDQFAYLGWIRDSAAHVLAGNLFDIPPGASVYLHPVPLVSGLLVRFGLPIEYALLPWKVVTALALVWSVHAYARRFFDTPRARLCAGLIGLFYVSPIAPVLDLIAGGLRMLSGTVQMSFESLNVIGVWGYAPSGVATALMPLYLLALERAVAGSSGATLRAAALGFFMAWFHPWQAATIGLVTVLLMASQRLWFHPTPILCGIATGLPLLGYLVLRLIDPHWSRAQDVLHTGPPLVRHLVIVFAPLVVLAAFQLRAGTRTLAEDALRLWPLAALVHVFVGPAMPSHALAGAAIPLGVLATRTLAAKAPRWLVPATLALVLPGFAWLSARLVHHVEQRAVPEALVIDRGEADALRFLARAPAGGVLADVFLGAAVPAWTGHAVWAGHLCWTPDYFERWPKITALMSGRLDADAARAFVRSTGARYVITGCQDRADLGALLGPLVAQRHVFGCATVYALN